MRRYKYLLPLLLMALVVSSLASMVGINLTAPQRVAAEAASSPPSPPGVSNQAAPKSAAQRQSATNGNQTAPSAAVKTSNSPFILPTFGTDVKVSSGIISGTVIAASPVSSTYFLAAANTLGGIEHAVTTDGGTSWTQSVISGAGDPIVAYDNSGNAYLGQLTTGTCPNPVTVYKSTDGGVIFNHGATALTDPDPGDHYLDLPAMAADQHPSSPYAGRIYVSATSIHTGANCDFAGITNHRQIIAYSTDGGASWSSPITISPNDRDQDHYSSIAVASTGALYYAYQFQDCPTDCNGVPAYQMLAKSNDGGVTWSPSTIITNQPISYTGAITNGHQYLYADSANTGFAHDDHAILGVSPTNPHLVYAMWSDGRFETTFTYHGITGWHSDIVFSRSTDGGNTWSNPIKVNDDPVQGKDQFDPAMTVGADGTIHASWLDRREAAVDGFAYREYYSQSTDGGLTWSANQPVADTTSIPSTDLGRETGIAANSTGDTVMPIWTDERVGQQAYADHGHITLPTATPTWTPGGPTATPTDTPTPFPTDTPTATPCPLGWVTNPPMPQARAGAAVAANGTFILVAGGDDGNVSHVTNDAWRFDGTDWVALPPMPISTTDAVALSDGDRFWVIGGRDVSGNPTTTVQIYDPEPNSWSFNPPLLTPAYAAAAAFVPGGLYVFGGCNDSSCSTPISDTQVFALADNVWHYGAPVPGGSAYGAADYDGVKSVDVAIGKDSTAQPSDQYYFYDFADNRWNTLALHPLPAARWAMGGATLNGEFYIAGGVITGTGMTNSTLGYVRSINNWETLPNLNQGSYRQQLVHFNGKLYIIGGQVGSGATSRVESFESVCGSAGTPTPQVTVTPTDCPNPFVDITGNIFYQAIHILNCRGVVSGVDATHYQPSGTSTRAAFAKIVVLGFGLPLSTPTGGPSFTDVPTSNFAYVYIETGLHEGILSGYDQAGCIGHGATFPCYLPNLAITRGQLTKLVVSAGHYAPYTPTAPDFTDVPPTNVFFVPIETAYHNSIVGGYPDHTYRPNNNIRRDEMAQIVFAGIAHMPLAGWQDVS